ncbi:LytTR family DNA-binding domain-containing protein [Ferrimonas balearica]|uniref:LytTR family DNA-binding domain-containing protein n=1 Tax=Ferrimonas balearica TaxID=44012 RepID=UPI001C9939D8|nr:LytTR family DNA-binding domain-containing protein [Ferrimonas balearica]MBY5920694.1 LytTR family transcriptional regulator DNA-binding domain-containing protein [Ferrimonas balearica]MBY5996621.1 LytTR family transcriptional regulator DNA-binding domain-containing protein [Ferrimonas balearica]
MSILAHNLYEASSLWQWPQRAFRQAPITVWLVGEQTHLYGLESYWPCQHINDAETLAQCVAGEDLNEVLVLLVESSGNQDFTTTLDNLVAEKRLPVNQLIRVPGSPDASQTPLIWALAVQGIERRFEYELSALEAQLIRTHQPAEQARLCSDLVSRWLDVSRIEFLLPGNTESRKTPRSQAIEFCWQTVPHCAILVHFETVQPQVDWIHSRFEALKLTQVACRQSFPNLQQAGYLGRLHEQRHRILYLVGANQYCEVVWADTSKTELLSMPLKMVHRYMHKELVQVHRSYLVNPDRVQGARRKRNGRVELFLHLTRIPVGDTYKQMLEETHSHWFDRAESTRRKAP